MDEIDNILNDLGVNFTPTSASSTEETSTTFSDEDIDNIIEENSIESNEEEEQVESDNSLAEQINEEIDEYLDEHPTPIENPVEENILNVEDTQEEATNNTLPQNSPTLLMDESTTRFSGAEWYAEIKKASIIIAGIGGIGSNIAFQLARMTPDSMILYDDDTVERVNMSGQLFSAEDVGKAKVDAIAGMISKYTTMQRIMAIQDKFTSLTTPGDIMICGFDNMSARKCFFESWMAHVRTKPDEEKGKCLFLDGRLSIDTLQVLCLKGDDEYNIMRYYKEFLFSDAQADATVCSMKQTTFLACMIGSIMVNLFTNFIANQLDPIIPYDLPFFTEYDAQNVIFKTEN